MAHSADKVESVPRMLGALHPVPAFFRPYMLSERKGSSGSASRKADDTGAQVAVEERGGGGSGGAAGTGAPGGHAPRTAAYTAAVAWRYISDCGGRGTADEA